MYAGRIGGLFPRSKQPEFETLISPWPFIGIDNVCSLKSKTSDLTAEQKANLILIFEIWSSFINKCLSP
jgi:hypothetical protein